MGNSNRPNDRSRGRPNQQAPRPPEGSAGAHSRNPKSREIVCLCNNVTRESIESAIKTGADTLNKIFDATTAGVGPCGGSCRRKLGPLLDHYLATGEFLEKVKPDNRGKKR